MPKNLHTKHFFATKTEVLNPLKKKTEILQEEGQLQSSNYLDFLLS